MENCETVTHTWQEPIGDECVSEWVNEKPLSKCHEGSRQHYIRAVQQHINVLADPPESNTAFIHLNNIG